jgi:polyisoprenoid-binding protein YceI
MNKVVKIGVVAVVVVVVAGGAYWWGAIRDNSSPTASLDAMNASAGSPSTPGTGPGGAGPDGTWVVQAGPDVWVGYRVNETILPARTKRTVNGRSTAVTGTMTIAGGKVDAASLTIDVSKLDSGEPMRDQVLQSIGLETATFKEATFALREPVMLPSGLTAGTPVDLTLKGSLTAHGTTRDLDIAVQAKWDGNQIAVASVGEGAAFVMADWGITLPRVPIVEDYDHGTLEAQLRFVKQ